MNISEVKTGSRWKSKAVGRSAAIVNSVSIYGNKIYWYYEDNEKNIYEMTYEVFSDSFAPYDD